MSAFVAFAGSRSLVAQGGDGAFVAQVVQSVLRSGRRVAVGCAVGGDELVLRALLAQGAAAQSQVFAAFVPEQGPVPQGRLPLVQGAWRGSAVRQVLSVSLLGASVRWLAGGGLGVPLRVRLKARSKAMVAFVSQSGPGAGLVAFVSGGWRQCPGTWGAVKAAVASGLPVVVFPCALAEPRGARPPLWWSGFLSSLPSLGAGHWASAGSGLWAWGFRWASG